MTDLDLGCAASIADPAGYFDTFRPDGAVQWSEAQRGWAVLSHAAVIDCFREGELLSADRITPLERVARERPASFGRVVDLLRGWMIFHDPPTHTRLREPVRAAFTPRRVSDLEAEISRIAAEAVDGLAGAVGPDGSVDLVAELAKPVPALVIAALLGVDPGERHRLQHWSDELAAIVFSTTPSTIPGEVVGRAAEEFWTFFGALVDGTRESAPGGLVASIAQLDASAYTRAELVGLCTLLLFAGHETTTGLLANAFALLLEDRHRLELLRDSPSLDEPAVEEFLRAQGSARTMVRKVATDHEREGVTLRRGENLYLSIAAANHDPAVFDHPAELDLARDPNPHLSFGWGLHHCLGAALARLESRIVIRTVLDRFPAMRLAGVPPTLVGNVLGFGRGPVRVHLD